MSAAVVSAIVAAAAVLVSGVMQYLTLQGARRNAALTAATTERSVSRHLPLRQKSGSRDYARISRSSQR